MSKVSVIIIAYNVQKYIGSAINSVISQTLDDIEIIVVDDKSTDGTFDIISKYAELDSRIKVIQHSENKSANIARLTGVENSEGEYVMFLDGDDTLVPNACERAYEAITKEKVDMLHFDFEMSFVSSSSDNETREKDFRSMCVSYPNKMVSISKAGMLDEKTTAGSITFTMWDKIYKRELLEKAGEKLPREYINVAEDWLYSFLIQYYTRSYSSISDRLYIYRFGCGISTTNPFKEQRIKSIAKNAYVYGYLEDFAEKEGCKEECKEALCRVYTQLYGHILATYLNCNCSENFKRILISEMLKYSNIDSSIQFFSKLIYEYNDLSETVAKSFSGLDMFKARKRNAKTIGVYYFRVYNGGIEKVISLLTDIWVKSGYEVVLFTDEEPNTADYYINPSVKRVTLPALKERDFYNIKQRIEVFRKELISNNVDIMVYNAWVNYDLVLDEMIIKSCGVNLIIHTHSLFCAETDCGDAMIAYRYSSLYNRYLFADSVVATTDVDNAWWQTLGFRCFKTKNPIEFDTGCETAQLNGNNLLLVARIAREKRIIDAIKIAELVRKEIPTVRLTIVGKGDDECYVKEVNDYIEQNNLSSLVDMVGYKSDVLSYYQCADVQLCSSAFEGFCLAIIEGKICGLPLVCYELPNLDITKNSKGMVIIKQGDTEAAARAVINILKNNALKKEMGRLARESAEEFFDIDLAERWNTIFKETLIPKEEKASIYEAQDYVRAVRIAVEKYTEGILKRANQPPVVVEKIVSNDEIVDELARIKLSESYRIGKIVTSPLRFTKFILEKVFRRK